LTLVDVYRVGVSIALQNNVSAALKVIQRDVLGLSRTVDLTQGKFDRLKLAVLGAGGLAGAGAAAAAFYGLARAGGEVLDAQVKMLQVGVSMRDVTTETAVAMRNVAIAGTTVSGNLSDLLRLRGILGGFPAANAALPGYERAKFALTGAGLNPDGIDAFIKPLDAMGAFNTNGQIDPSKFAGALQMAVSAVLTTGGLLTGPMFQRAVQLAGPAAAQMGEAAFLNSMTEPLLALGQRAARGLQYSATTLIGGQMSKASAMRLDTMGLTTASDFSHEGGRWTLNPNTIAGASLLNSGQIIDWIQKYFLPAAAKAHMSPLVAAASFPQTMQGLITSVAELGPQIARFVALNAQAQTASPSDAAMKALGGATDNFRKALDSLWQALGVPEAMAGVRILNNLSGGIRTFAAFIGTHPAYAKGVEEMLLGLGVALGVLGAAAVATAIAGLVGSGGTIAAVAVGITALAGAFHEFPGAIKEVEAGFRGLENFLGIGGPSAPHSALPPPGIHGQYGRHVPGQLGMNSEDHLAQLASWVQGGAVVIVGSPVTIGNTGDIARGANAYGQKQLQKPNTGASGVNLRSTPSGSAALAMPGFG
jgi:hypothetical protein